jgi:hypothetical protein
VSSPSRSAYAVIVGGNHGAPYWRVNGNLRGHA